MHNISKALITMRRLVMDGERRLQGIEDPKPFKLGDDHLKDIAAAKFELVKLTVDTRFAVAHALGKYGEGLRTAGLAPEHQDVLTIVNHLHTSGSLAGLSDPDIFRVYGWLKQFEFLPNNEDVYWAAASVAEYPEFLPWLRDFNPEQYKSAQDQEAV